MKKSVKGRDRDSGRRRDRRKKSNFVGLTRRATTPSRYSSTLSGFFSPFSSTRCSRQLSVVFRISFAVWFIKLAGSRSSCLSG